MHSAGKEVETTNMTITMIVLLDYIVVIHVLCRNNLNVHFSPRTPPDETFNILLASRRKVWDCAVPAVTFDETLDSTEHLDRLFPPPRGLCVEFRKPIVERDYQPLGMSHALKQPPSCLYLVNIFVLYIDH